MAVKVMLAPAIAKGQLAPKAAAPRREPAAAKPKRRRSSVYDADGNEVFITLMCLKCHKMRPLSQFGLRKMADGAIRNQPWCRGCRSAAGPAKAKGGEGTEIVESPAAQEPVAPPAAAPEPAKRASSQVAAEVAAALDAGLRR